MADDRPTTYTRPAPSTGGTVSGWLVAILMILFVALYFKMSGLWPSPLFDPNAKERTVTPRGDLAQDEKATIELFQAVNRSVVHIRTSAVVQDDFHMNPSQIAGTGSGFVWESRGYIVTNYHVVRDAEGNDGKINVSLPSSPTTYSAEIVGVDPDADLAVLKINAPAADLKPITVGTSKDLKVGQKVFAIGSPFSLDQSLTTGIISGLGREINSPADVKIKDVIQVSAPINPGNSGGPLLDSAGRLIGVTTAIASRTGEFSGVGFAIPVDTVNAVVTQLIRSGTAPDLGVNFFGSDFVEKLRASGYIKDSGLLVRSVTPGGSADAAGIRPTRQVSLTRIALGDLIVAVDGHPVSDNNEILQVVSSKKVGDTIKITVVRGDERLDIPVTLLPRRARPRERE